MDSQIKELLLGAGVVFVEAPAFLALRNKHIKPIYQHYEVQSIPIADEREAFIYLMGQIKNDKLVYVYLQNGELVDNNCGYTKYILRCKILDLTPDELSYKIKQQLAGIDHKIDTEITSNSNTNNYKYLLIR